MSKIKKKKRSRSRAKTWLLKPPEPFSINSQIIRIRNNGMRELWLVGDENAPGILQPNMSRVRILSQRATKRLIVKPPLPKIVSGGGIGTGKRR